MNKFPTPRELKQEFPLEKEEQEFVAQSREIAKAIVKGEDQRLALIVGPCSIHEIETALTYADRLAALSEKVSESCFLVMRVYVEKSRTATGWKGMLYDPHLDGSHVIETGLKLSRQLFLELTMRKIPIATEFVDPLAALYLNDLVTWGFIGARTFCSQPHRQLASSLNFPVGFKNGLDGDIDQTIHSLLAANSPHVFLYADEEGRLASTESHGNPCSHLVLRGALTSTNYDRHSVEKACEKLISRRFAPRLMIDCAHGNSRRDAERQKEVFFSVLKQVREDHGKIMGMMIESHLLAGNQSLSEGEDSLKFGVSITDPCLDWSSTEELILTADSLLSSSLI